MNQPYLLIKYELNYCTSSTSYCTVIIYIHIILVEFLGEWKKSLCDLSRCSENHLASSLQSSLFMWKLCFQCNGNWSLSSYHGVTRTRRVIIVIACQYPWRCFSSSYILLIRWMDGTHTYYWSSSSYHGNEEEQEQEELSL